MVNSNIFLGSGASTTLIPEQDLVISNITQSYTNNNELNFVDFGSVYSLVPNLYIGCEFELYSEAVDGSGDLLVSTHTVKSNTKNSLISSTNLVSFVAAKMHYIIIKRYGSPSPSKPFTHGGTVHQRLNADNWIGIAETITFPSLEQDLKQMNLGLGGTRNFSYQYKGIRTASGGSLALTASNGSWLYYALGEIDQIKYTVEENGSTSTTGIFETTTNATATAAISCIYDGTITVTLTNPADIKHIAVGMTLPVSAAIANGQTVASVSYGNGLSDPVVAPSFTLSAVADATATETPVFTNPAANREIFDGTADKIFVIDANANQSADATATATASELVESGPLLFRTVRGGTATLPPFNPILHSDVTKMNIIKRGTDLAPQMITYRIKEGNTSDLPSFTLEQSISKDPAVIRTNALYDAAAVEAAANQESQSFTRLARGNRVNSLTLEASEGEEVKFNIDVNSRLVDSITDIYHKGGLAPTFEARNGITENDQLFNWNAGTNSGAPFFFSAGSMEAFGQQFLKVNSISLEIANNLQDKRYMGGHRDMKEGLAAQRTYVLSFTAIVTDDEIFRYYLNESETVGTQDVNLFKMRFDKEDNSEFIDLQFKNYFLDTANWTIPDDKGPVTIEATIKPRDLHSCTIGTDWAILG